MVNEAAIAWQDLQVLPSPTLGWQMQLRSPLLTVLAGGALSAAALALVHGNVGRVAFVTSVAGVGRNSGCERRRQGGHS